MRGPSRSPIAVDRRRRAIALGIALLSAVVALYPSGERATARASSSFVVIVNPKNPTSTASRDFLSAAFLKRTTRWSDGEAIRPVDQRPSSTVRKAFSESVLKRSVVAVRNYWQQRIFSGRDVPPPELDSDREVVEYVLKNRGAVGYVSSGAATGEAKVISVK